MILQILLEVGKQVVFFPGDIRRRKNKCVPGRVTSHDHEVD